jgi:hypothetical protein
MSDGVWLGLGASLGVWMFLFAAVLGVLSLVLFFLPTIIAFRRDHRNRWVIFLINFVFGATVLGWIGALIWAMNKIDDPLKGGVKYDPQTHDPMV